MTRQKARSGFLRAAVFSVFVLLLPSVCLGWGAEGHRMVNGLALENLPADLPAFLRTQAAVDEIEYLGPEPDRWRSPAEPELNSAQAPEHFIDLEVADRIGPLPRKRYDYIAALYATGAAHPEWAGDLRPERVGLQPYVTIEIYERLQSAFREYRAMNSRKEDTRSAEAAVLFYAGWLGHYVADGSQPLHVTRNYDGWVETANPGGYSNRHGIHEHFEMTFVNRNVHRAAVRERMTAPHMVMDPFADYVVYLRKSASLVEQVYQLEKEEGFAGTGTAKSRSFTADRLAAGANELSDLIYSAWLSSAP